MPEMRLIIKYLLTDKNELLIKALGCMQGLSHDEIFRELFISDENILKALIGVILKNTDINILCKVLAIL